ncbi:MAG: metal ABC transporter ATP-binding protein [Chloroflexi bacterium]|nr:metal ABC transporter ATP-binding protein [Chloroflexota bacterium]
MHNHAVATLPALKVEGVSAGYPDDRRAISGIEFEVQRGERVAVLGPNGAGKSTLFKAIAGVIPFTSGQISLLGRDCRSSHDLIGYVPQVNIVDWTFPATVGDVVMMGRARRIGWLRWPRRDDWDAVRHALDQVGMLEHIDRRIGALSGGQKQRVFIARALTQSADVLLLDEPFNGVDVTTIEEILATLDRLRDDGVTVMVATHDIELALSEFDKLLLLKRTLIAYGRPAEVYTPEHLKAAYGSRVSIMHDGDHTLITVDEHGCC